MFDVVLALSDANCASTSPSIYMGFSSISRAPNLEIPIVLGTGPEEPVEAPLCTLNPTLLETMLSFAPGELSTLAGGQGLEEGNLDLTTRSFNFGDLPCPPQSVMVGSSRKPYTSLTHF